MTLVPGSRLGAYDIIRAIGAGGMGEVYRAKDSRLGRDVAIKVLPEAFAQDPERLARFEREARLLASLNHSNIAHVYGFESATVPGGATAYFLAMEMVEGEDLGVRLKRGPVPVDEAIAIAKQIAEGLEEAHEKGIVHRDLKPANIKVTPDGRVKVLDFGLAKALEGDPAGSAKDPELSHSPTMSRHGTEAGMILGTAAYMAPEQARGKAVDKRADIWAFGVVLFEMLTGERLFAGETVSDTLAGVLKDAPRFGALPPQTPPRLRRLIERCLERDTRVRLRDIGEARVEIAKIEAGVPEPGLGSVVLAAGPPPRARRAAPLVIAGAAAAAMATFALTRWLMPGAAITNNAVAHVSIALPDGDEMYLGERPLAVSDDGTRIAYVGLRSGKSQIYLRTLSESVPKALDGTEGATSPFFSPDGQWLAFFSDSKLRKIAVGGGALQALADAPFSRGGDWGSDGYIYFAPTNVDRIRRVPEDGGPAEDVTRKDTTAGEISHRWPQVIAGTNTLIFGVWTGPGDDEHSVAMQTLGGARHHVLVNGGDAPQYAAGLGMLVYSHVNDLFAVPWRPPQESLGKAVPVAMPERTNEGGYVEGAGNYVLSADGSLAYLAGGQGRNSNRLAWIDRSGKLDLPPLPERNYASAAISPDGERAIVQIREGVVSLWMYDFARNTLTPVGASTGSSQSPVWTRDGARVIYRGTRKGLRNVFWRAADGSGNEEALTTKDQVVQSPSSVSPDGQWLVFTESGAQEIGGRGIWVMRLDGDRSPRHLFPQPAGERNGQVSPDGKWIAFEATVASRTEVYVAPFPGPGPRRQVSAGGGAEPLWSRDGRELFFQQGVRLMRARVTAGATFSASPPEFVHEERFLKSQNDQTSWSVTPDGSRFLRVQQVDPERALTRIDLVLNWFEKVRAKVASR